MMVGGGIIVGRGRFETGTHPTAPISATRASRHVSICTLVLVILRTCVFVHQSNILG